MPSISAIVLTRNEEHNIRRCLESLQWVEQIVVVDAESTDRTVEIARQYSCAVFVRPWEGYAATRTFALEHCCSEWVLWIDADECVTDELRDEILRTLERNPVENGFTMPRLSYFLGRWIRYSGWYPNRVLRLFRRRAARFTQHRVHESVVVEGSIGTLRSHLLHYTDPTLEHYLAKFNTYTTLAAQDLFEQGRAFRWRDVLLRPAWCFVRMYILRLGVLDGFQGFVLAVMSSAYVFTKYVKLWQLQQGLGQQA